MGWGTPHELERRAKDMRRQPTDAEKRLWRHLSNSQLSGFKFRRQARLGWRIADLFCPSIGLIVETVLTALRHNWGSVIEGARA